MAAVVSSICQLAFVLVLFVCSIGMLQACKNSTARPPQRRNRFARLATANDDANANPRESVPIILAVDQPIENSSIAFLGEDQQQQQMGQTTATTTTDNNDNRMEMVASTNSSTITSLLGENVNVSSNGPEQITMDLGSTATAGTKLANDQQRTTTVNGTVEHAVGPPKVVEAAAVMNVMSGNDDSSSSSGPNGNAQSTPITTMEWQRDAGNAEATTTTAETTITTTPGPSMNEEAVETENATMSEEERGGNATSNNNNGQRKKRSTTHNHRSLLSPPNNNTSLPAKISLQAIVNGGPSAIPLMTTTEQSQTNASPNSNANFALNPAAIGGPSAPLFDVQACTSADCNGHGTCMGMRGLPLCLCTAGYTGSRCQQSSCNPAQNCNSHGWCVGTSQQFTCFCNYGFSGAQCEQQNGR